MSIKILIAILFTAAITVLCMQNTDSVQFEIFVWSYYAPKVAVMILLAALGFILGLTVRFGKKNKNAKYLKDSSKKNNNYDNANTSDNTHTADINHDNL
ncbi:MAG: hypothetical protein ACQPRJ_02175 [Solitalea-like symbiont of Acarus siro]